MVRLVEFQTPKKLGTYVGVSLTDESAEAVSAWMDQQPIKNPLTKEELHVTLALSKETPFAHTPIHYRPPMPVDLDYEFEFFGDEKNVMVLLLKCPSLEKRHADLKAEFGFEWDYPTYQPHISLSYTTQPTPDDIMLPDFVIELGSEHVEPFGD